MKKVHKHNVFFKFLVSYFIVLLIPITLGVFAYERTLLLVEEGIKGQNIAVLQQSKDILDARLHEVNTVLERLTLNKDILNMMKVQNPLVKKETVYTVQQIQERISVYKLTNNFIRSFFIHFSYNDIIISPDDVFLNIENFYGKFFKYNEMDYPQWRSEMLDGYHQREYMPSAPVMLKDQTGTQNQPMIACVQTIPNYGSIQDKATVIMLINASDILKLLEKLNIHDDGWAYILDDQNRLIVSTSNKENTSIISDGFVSDSGMIEVDIDQKSMMVHYSKSDYNGWKYVAVLPKSVVMSKVNYAKQLLVGFLIVSLIIGFILAYVMASRSSKPISEIIRALQSIMGNDRNEEKNDLMFMRNSVAALIANNESLQNKMKDQIPLLNASFLNQILNGEFISHPEAEAFSEQMGFVVRDSLYVGVLIRINSLRSSFHHEEYLDNMNAMKVILKEALMNYGEGRIYTHDVDFDRLFLIINIGPEQKDQYIQITEKITEEVSSTLNKEYGILLKFAAGNPVESITNIAGTFSEAKITLDYKIEKSAGRVIWYNEVPKESKGYYYPVDVEMRLINYAKAGDQDGIEKLLDTIYAENYIERMLSAPMMKYLINNMSCTVIKLLETSFYGMNESSTLVMECSAELENCATAKEFFDTLLGIYQSICTQMDARKKSNNVKLKESILDYLKQSFTDSQISLVSIADKFGLSEVYLSQFFKEQTGENFSNYTEKLRIEYACSLLRSTNTTIEDIAEKCGYNSAHVFRSAFKRIEGISPSAYRQDGRFPGN